VGNRPGPARGGARPACDGGKKKPRPVRPGLVAISRRARSAPSRQAFDTVVPPKSIREPETETNRNKRAAKVAGSTLIPDHDGLVELTMPRFSGAARLRCVTERPSWAPGARSRFPRLGFLSPLGSAPMSGIVARVLVVLFGVSFGCGLIREMVSRHRKVRTARRHLGTVDTSTQ